MIGLGSDKNDNARIGDWRQIDYWYLGEKVSWEIKGEGAAFIQVVLKVDYISDSTTNVGRALKMESVMSSFRLLMAENNRYVKLAFLQLNLYMVTSIGAGQPQFVQSNQCHQVPKSVTLYWLCTKKYQLLVSYTDPVHNYITS